MNAEANRIKNLQYNGQPIDLEQEFLVATNNYRAGGNFPGVRNQTAVEMYPDENRQAIIDYIQEQQTIDPSADGNWTFAPVANEVKVIFESSLDAQNAISPESGITFMGEASNESGKYSMKLPVADSQLIGK